MINVVMDDMKKRRGSGFLESKEFAARISENGEELSLTLKSGKILSREEFFALAINVTLADYPGSPIVLPISAPVALENLAKSLGGKIIYSKTGKAAVMRETYEKGISLQNHLLFDGIFAACYIIDFLNRNNTSIEAILEGFPEIFAAECEVDCPDRFKKDVLSQLLAKNKNARLDMTEGIKIFTGNGWALIIPDNHREICKIIIEGESEESAADLRSMFEKEISAIVKG
jgi:phosphomannomutase